MKLPDDVATILIIAAGWLASGMLALDRFTPRLLGRSLALCLSFERFAINVTQLQPPAIDSNPSREPSLFEASGSMANLLEFEQLPTESNNAERRSGHSRVRQPHHDTITHHFNLLHSLKAKQQRQQRCRRESEKGKSRNSNVVGRVGKQAAEWRVNAWWESSVCNPAVEQ